MVKINASFQFPLFYQVVQIGFFEYLRDSWPLRLFYFDNSKVFVFVDVHFVRVCEDTIDVSLCFMEISCY